MWRELVQRHYSDYRFQPGASQAVMVDVESRLGQRLPLDLRALLSESDGVAGEYGLALIWPTSRIAEDNLRFRSAPEFRDYSPFDALLFFADAGNGDHFAFQAGSETWDRDIYSWNHDNDSRMWVAPDLRRYLEWWADGRIEL